MRERWGSGVVTRWAVLGIDPEVVYPWWRQLTRSGPELLAALGDAPGFHILPRRWMVERALAWLGRSCRLSKHYERRPATSEALVYLAGIRLLLARLTRA
jgi:putative transposase